MPPEPNLVNIELLVPRISDALAVFVDVLGFELAHRGPAPDVAAEIAVLDAGSVVLTLIEPVEAAGPVVPDVTPRLSQIHVQLGDDRSAACEALMAAGLPVEVLDDGSSFVAPGAMVGVVGFPMALVLRDEADAG